jgi:isopenicillin-N epimerase
MAHSLKAAFLLDPEVVYLNHGSYGACPRPVFEEYQRWQRELERQPVAFLGRRNAGLMAEARAALAEYIGAAADDVVYFPNPTTAANMAARSLGLGPGDEVLATDLEYGAMDRTWRFLAGQAGFTYTRRPVALPVTTAEALVDDFWAGVSERTRVIFISHITSATALKLPIEPILARARAAGLLTIVDGAHAPGQVPLDLEALGADVYIGANHKWLCAPKGSAFLYASPALQPRLMPLVVSWGYESEAPSGSQFVDYHEWAGTRDIAAYLATPAAIRFQAEHDWPAVRARCHALVREARARLNALTGQPALCPENAGWYEQMAAVRLPPGVDCAALKRRLYDAHRIEVPVYRFNGEPLLRVSVQGYNTEADVEAVVGAVGMELQRA